jgi:hypothetical protein
VSDFRFGIPRIQESEQLRFLRFSWLGRFSDIAPHHNQIVQGELLSGCMSEMGHSRLGRDDGRPIKQVPASPECYRFLRCKNVMRQKRTHATQQECKQSAPKEPSSDPTAAKLSPRDARDGQHLRLALDDASKRMPVFAGKGDYLGRLALAISCATPRSLHCESAA